MKTYHMQAVELRENYVVYGLGKDRLRTLNGYHTAEERHHVQSHSFETEKVEAHTWGREGFHVVGLLTWMIC